MGPRGEPVMARTRFDTDRLLLWLGEVLKGSKSVDVDIVVVDEPHAGSSLQIIVSGDLPGPLAGLQIRSPGPD